METDRSRGLERVYLVERYDRHALLQLPPFKQVFAHLFVLHYDVVQPSSGGDLECGRLVEVLLGKVNEGGYESLYL